jgi:hypothetical protein
MQEDRHHLARGLIAKVNFLRWIGVNRVVGRVVKNRNSAQFGSDR